MADVVFKPPFPASEKYNTPLTKENLLTILAMYGEPIEATISGYAYYENGKIAYTVPENKTLFLIGAHLSAAYIQFDYAQLVHDIRVTRGSEIIYLMTDATAFYNARGSALFTPPIRVLSGESIIYNCNLTQISGYGTNFNSSYYVSGLIHGILIDNSFIVNIQ